MLIIKANLFITDRIIFALFTQIRGGLVVAGW